MNKKYKALIICVALIANLACSSTMFPSLTATPTATLIPTVNPDIRLIPTVEGYIDSNIYSTGIEVVQVVEVPGIIDHTGGYALQFHENWILGPLHVDFAPVVEKEGVANENVKGLFEYFLKNDSNIRAFGFSTLPTQLNKDSFVVVVVKMFNDDKYLSQTIGELADTFIASQPAQELVNFTYRSEPLTSALDVPTIIMLNEVKDRNGNITIYNGILLAKLDSAYVQVFFLTNNSKINLGEELAYPASSIMDYDK